MIDQLKMIDDVRDAIIAKYYLTQKITTRNNVIWRNEDLALIQNTTTGDLKLKRNLR